MTSTRIQDLHSLQITDRDFVVELGGGHAPFWRSDIIFDKYPFENLHRSQDLAHPVPVLIADATRIPLRDGGCDLLFASHIIEHLPAPDLFLQEVQRCAMNVYLEFPGRSRELLFGWAMHEWLVEVQGTHLVFYRNDIPQLFGDLFHSHYDFLLDAWMMQRHALLNSHLAAPTAALSWEFARVGAFEHVISSSRHGRAKVDTASAVPVEYTWRQLAVLALQKALSPRALDAAVAVWRRRRRGSAQPVTQPLLDRLACPACRSATLVLANDIVACHGCHRAYHRRGGLFDLDIVGEAAPDPR